MVINSAIWLLIFLSLYWLITINVFDFSRHNSKCNDLQNQVKSMDTFAQAESVLKIIGESDVRKIENMEPYLGPYISYQVYWIPNDSLLFWSDASYRLNADALENLKRTTYREIEGDKFLLKSVFYKDKQIVFWFHLNLYLEQKLNSGFKLFHNKNERNEYTIIGYKDANSMDLKDSQNNFLCSLKRSNYQNDLWTLMALLALSFAAFFYIKSIYYFCKPLTETNPLTACFIFISVIYLSRKFIVIYKLPALIFTLKLFNPSLYNSDVTPSLGDLFLLVSSMQIILYYLQQNLKLNFNRDKNNTLKWIVHTLALIFLLGESFSINKIFERMVLESSIWFNFDYFPRLTVYSFIALGIMLMSFSNYYLLSNIVLKVIHGFYLNHKKMVASFTVFFFTLLGLVFFTSYRIELKLTFIVLFVFIILFYLRHLLNIRSRILSFAIFLFFASFTTTLLLSRYNVKKEEVILSSIAANISFGLDKKNETEIIKQLRTGNYENFLVKLKNFKGIDFKSIDQLEFQKCLDPSRSILNHLLYSDQNFKLYFIQENSTRNYLIQFTNPAASHFLLIYPQTHLTNLASSTTEAIYDVIVRDNKISFALYQNDTLKEQYGLFNYQKLNKVGKNVQKFSEESLGLEFEHTIFRVDGGINVFVTVQKANPVSIITQFSYVFCINFVLSLLLFLLAWSLKITYVGKPIFHFNELRSKIVIAIFFLIISIFAGITFLSYNSLRTKINNYNKEVAFQSLKVTKLALEQSFANSKPEFMQNFDSYFKRLKGVSNLNYEIFDHSGVLMQSNIMGARDLHLPRLIKPTVLFGKQDLWNEEFSEDGVTETYSVLHNLGARPIYMRLSIGKDDHAQNDEMRFIVVLINLYVLFFLISMFFSVWLANRITKPLKTLTDKISMLGIEKKNEHIEYRFEDEIGELVKRYNIMVDEIRESTRLLAEQEREGAWREMAKQIAHEIKNPLTPMKLKIQLLQKKIKDGDKNIELLVNSTTESLIEQINNLDNIATSFSNFGQLHTPHFEILDWISLIQNTIHVFQSKDVHIYFETRLDLAQINCDRSQMVSCINNLVKNAIQSYKDDEIEIYLSLAENAEVYILEIKDFGQGIDDSQIDKIFIPNFTTKNSGSGLGLAITKKILTLINGKIWFHSTVGKGTSFYISLPKVLPIEELPYTARETEWIEHGFKEICKDDFIIDLEYRYDNNVFQTKLYTDFNKAFVHARTWKKLLKARDLLAEVRQYYQLIIKDALRPFEVQKKMWDTYQGDGKEQYIAPPDRDSMHNYGMAIDVMIVERMHDSYTPNKPLDFGCDYDEFSEKAHTNYPHLTPQQAENRGLLRRIMVQAGFIAYDNEFWHFEAMYKDWVRENCNRI